MSDAASPAPEAAAPEDAAPQNAAPPPDRARRPAEALDSPRRDLIIGGIVAGLFFILFLGWAALAPLDAGAYAQGQVAVSGNRQAVQHRDGGVVGALHVAEGDRVEAGQVLLEIAAGELIANERGATGQVLALLAQRSRMIAERDGLSSVPTPPEFAALPPADRPLAEEALRLQRLQFSARRSGRGAETGVLGQRIGQLEQQIEGYQRQLAANVEQKRLIDEELTGMRSLAERGYAPLTRVRALERNAAQLDGEDGALRAQIARAREQIGETRLQMSAVSTRLNEDVADQLRLLEVELNGVAPRLAEMRAQIARNQVRAPATGQVVGLTVFTPGGVIQPGQTLMDIVPDDADQVIVARINPGDIDNLQIGLDTEIRFPGLRERNPPIVHGRVSRISADAIRDEGGGEPYFRTEIIVPEDQLARLGASAETITPGMPVEVVVLLKKRTALDYLIEPLTRSLWRSGSTQ